MTLGRLRVPLGFAAAALVFYFATPSPGSLLGGLPVALAGLVFRGAAAGVIRKNDVLARQGPYTLTRNPLYFGSFLLATGFALMSGNLLAAGVLLIPSTLIYPRVIRDEEQHLRKLFGKEYEDFRQQIPAFFPRRLHRGWARSFSGPCYMANREYNAALGFIGAAGILFVKYWLSVG